MPTLPRVCARRRQRERRRAVGAPRRDRGRCPADPRDGWARASTMRSLADRLEIRAPLLYKHVADKDEVEALLIAEASEEWERRCMRRSTVAVTRSKEAGALATLARAYERGRSRIPTCIAWRPRANCPRVAAEGLEAWTAEPLLRVTGDQDRARAAWAFAHGMTILELDGRFPPTAHLDVAWEAGTSALV